MIRNLLARAVDLLYPRTCGHCGRIGQAWCAACLDRLIDYPFALYSRVLASGLEVYCAGEHAGPLRDAIHAFKFDDARYLAGVLGAALDEALLQAELQIDVVTPVPLHQKREKWRGYNQSALLADVLAQNIGVPCLPLLERTRYTGTQVGRTSHERLAAVRDAFTADALARGKRVLLVDDVVTTGATLDACAAALAAAGADYVAAACVASR